MAWHGLSLSKSSTSNPRVHLCENTPESHFSPLLHTAPDQSAQKEHHGAESLCHWGVKRGLDTTVRVYILRLPQRAFWESLRLHITIFFFLGFVIGAEGTRRGTCDESFRVEEWEQELVVAIETPCQVVWTCNRVWKLARE